ncbi:uncharacterized protein MYCFIDRAFT_195102 [Pseudocercospora fijiensis CIRAD86]|uniref:F-box domain-containing protein n=1 Tax=Pseudocercospora fijiensis (strain CIRAD86) TaxID=383855 RepID=M2Z251_PSEFD|nr:uncharacterized protein MYCFIDRAFT_195102 [Pseudocercospora fijiensis CIRAD86]EME83900.1 hypothetical protein MYCFIDRAFT_195102 [Pseudocercospora fijiensis CIRAD86]
MLNLSFLDLFVIQRTNNNIRDTSHGSTKLKQRMFLESPPAEKLNGKVLVNPLVERHSFTLSRIVAKYKQSDLQHRSWHVEPYSLREPQREVQKNNMYFTSPGALQTGNNNIRVVVKRSGSEKLDERKDLQLPLPVVKHDNYSSWRRMHITLPPNVMFSTDLLWERKRFDSSSLQQAMFLLVKPDASSSPFESRAIINPLLSQIIIAPSEVFDQADGLYFSQASLTHGDVQNKTLDLFICSETKAWKPWLRRLSSASLDVSWKRMLISQPPPSNFSTKLHAQPRFSKEKKKKVEVSFTTTHGRYLGNGCTLGEVFNKLDQSYGKFLDKCKRNKQVNRRDLRMGRKGAGKNWNWTADHVDVFPGTGRVRGSAVIDRTTQTCAASESPTVTISIMAPLTAACGVESEENETSSKAYHKVVHTTEVLEQILLNLDCITLYGIQRVCRAFRSTSQGSKKLRQEMFLEAETEQKAGDSGKAININPLIVRGVLTPTRALHVGGQVDGIQFGYWDRHEEAYPILMMYLVSEESNWDMRMDHVSNSPEASWRRMFISQPPRSNFRTDLTANATYWASRELGLQLWERTSQLHPGRSLGAVFAVVDREYEEFLPVLEDIRDAQKKAGSS